VTSEDYAQLQRRIDAERDPMAMADALVRGRVEPSEGRRVARSLLETNDPVLVRAVSFFLARERRTATNPAPMQEPRTRDPDRQELAWYQAACALGDDCGPDDVYTRVRCAFRGQCDGGAVDAEVLKERNRIVAAIRSRDWESLGL